MASIKKSSDNDDQVQQFIKSTKERMAKVYSLVLELNNRFYLKSGAMDMDSDAQDVINEAEALCTVLRENDKYNVVN